MSQTEQKVQHLKDAFPAADESALLELLLSCNGSLKTTESVLLESFPEGPLRKRYKPSERQGNIKRLLGADDHAALASTNTTGQNKPVYLYSKEDVERTVPYATIYYNFLPSRLSNDLLKGIMMDQKGFSPQEFYLFGNKCISNHHTKLYAINRTEAYYYNGIKTDFSEDALYTEEMKDASTLIKEKVNSLISERERLPYQQKDPWECNVVVCNKFHSKSNDLDWHSDRLTYIGPHCTVASMTLGCKREFRIRKAYNDEVSATNMKKNNNNTIYSIPLPHNTLLVMHAGFQEEYQHCVSSTTEITNHPISGSLRVNLTYRHYLPNFIDHLPMCDKCGHQMDLRRSYKKPEVRGRYIWRCSGSYMNKECSRSYYADFEHGEKKLYTEDPDRCAIWIARDDKVALQRFREEIMERLERRDGKRLMVNKNQ